MDEGMVVAQVRKVSPVWLEMGDACKVSPAWLEVGDACGMDSTYRSVADVTGSVLTTAKPKLWMMDNSCTQHDDTSELLVCASGVCHLFATVIRTREHEPLVLGPCGAGSAGWRLCRLCTENCRIASPAARSSVRA